MDNIRFAPLSSSFLAASIIGFLVSVWFIMDWSESWGFAFATVFVLMFISSMVSMVKAEPVIYHMRELAVHEHSQQYRAIENGPKWLEKKKFEFTWVDPLFTIYFIAAVLYLLNGLSYSAKPVTPALFVGILVITIIIGIAMIVEVISSERMKWHWQSLLTIFIIVTGPVGMLVYYVIRKVRVIK